MACTIFSFGMHQGKTFQQVFDNDKWYVSWAFKQEGAGAIKQKTGLLQRFVDFCRSEGADKENGAKLNIPQENFNKVCSGSQPVACGTNTVPATPCSQQATQAEYVGLSNFRAQGMAPGLCTMPGIGTMPAQGMVPSQGMMSMPGQGMVPGQGMPQGYIMMPGQGTVPTQNMLHGQHMMPSQGTVTATQGLMQQVVAPPPRENRADPTWERVLEHLEEKGIDFDTVVDAHQDTRRDILRAVFFGDPILRAQAETQWLRLRMEKLNQQRPRSRSRGRSKMNFKPVSLSAGVSASASAAF